jgi:hypothetical protein
VGEGRDPRFKLREFPKFTCDPFHLIQEIKRKSLRKIVRDA